MPMQLAAPIEQQHDQDLQRMPELADTILWLEEIALANTPVPAVVTGLWLSQDVARAHNFLKVRSSQGFSTLVVPRYTKGDLAGILGAPTAVRILPGDTTNVLWQDGTVYAVPAVSYLETSLPAGRWAVSKRGALVLGYRPSAAAGPIILCMANIAGRPVGVKREEQARLLQRLLQECPVVAVDSTLSEQGDRKRCADADMFLRETGPAGAALALALVAANGDMGADLDGLLRNSVGITLDENKLALLQQRLPDAGADTWIRALEQFGWAAYLRRIARMKTMEAD